MIILVVSFPEFSKDRLTKKTRDVFITSVTSLIFLAINLMHNYNA